MTRSRLKTKRTPRGEEETNGGQGNIKKNSGNSGVSDLTRIDTGAHLGLKSDQRERPKRQEITRGKSNETSEERAIASRRSSGSASKLELIPPGARSENSRIAEGRRSQCRADRSKKRL